MTRRAVQVGAAVALALALPSSGFAAVRVGGQDGTVGNVALTDGAVLWTAQVDGPTTAGSSDTATETRLFRGAPGGRAADLGVLATQESDGYYGGGETVGRLVASGGTVAFLAAGYDVAKGKYTGNGTTSTSLDLFDLTTKRITRVFSCGEFGGALPALAGTSLLSVGCTSPAQQGAGAVELRDVRTPKAPATPLGDQAFDVRLAGRMAAWRTADALVVRNLDTGAEVQRVPSPRNLSSWDVQADGKLAIGIGAATTGGPPPTANQIQWFAPGESTPHAFMVDPFESLRLVADRFLYMRRGSDLLDALVVADLSGAERVIARFGSAGPFAYDGTRAAWAARTCSGASILLEADVAAITTPGISRLDRCPVTVDQYAAMDKKGRLGVEARCPQLIPGGPSAGCTVTLRIRSGRRVVGTVTRKVDAGSTRSIAIPTTRRFRRAQAKRVRIDVSATMRGGTVRSHATVFPIY